MKDREKQIEEMAKDIPYLTLERDVYISATEMAKHGWTLSEEDNKVISEHLILKGWIKPTEDIIMLSKEDLNKKYVSRDTYNTEIEYRKVLEKRSCKEMVEKFAKLVYSTLTNIKVWNEMHNWWLEGKECPPLKNLLNELAKQLGVE